MGPMFLEPTVGRAQVGHQLLARAGFDQGPQRAEAGLVWHGPHSWQPAGHAQRPVAATLHGVEERRCPGLRWQRRGCLDRQLQRTPGAVVGEPDSQAGRRVRPEALARQAGNRRRQPGRLDAIEAEVDTNSAQLLARLDVRLVADQWQASQADHGWYRRARHVASSWSLPNFWTPSRATTAGLSPNRPG